MDWVPLTHKIFEERVREAAVLTERLIKKAYFRGMQERFKAAWRLSLSDYLYICCLCYLKLFYEKRKNIFKLHTASLSLLYSSDSA